MSRVFASPLTDSKVPRIGSALAAARRRWGCGGRVGRVAAVRADELLDERTLPYDEEAVERAAAERPPKPTRGRRCARPDLRGGSAGSPAHRRARARSPERSASPTDERASAPDAVPPRSPAGPGRRRSEPRLHSGPHRRITRGPPPDRRPERARPADPPQTALMMAADLLRDQIAAPTRDRDKYPSKRADRRTRNRVYRA